MAPNFTWDPATHKFIGPAQKASRERVAAESAKLDEAKLVSDVCAVCECSVVTYLVLLRGDVYRPS